MHLLYRFNNIWKAPWKSSCVSVSMAFVTASLSLQLSHNDNLNFFPCALGISKSHREQGLDYREGDELSWCPSWWNSVWQGWSCGLVHCSGGNATDTIGRVWASFDGISCWTPLKPQNSIPCWLSCENPVHVDHASAVNKRHHQKFVAGFALFGLLGSGRTSMLLLGTLSLGLWVTAVDLAFIAGHQSIKNCGFRIDQLGHLPAVMTTSFFLIFFEHPWDKPYLQFLANNCVYISHTDMKLSTYWLYRHTTVLIHEILYLANQLWCSDFLTPPTPLVIPHRLPVFLESFMPLKNWCSIHARLSKSSLKYSIRFCGIFSKFKTQFYSISFF